MTTTLINNPYNKSLLCKCSNDAFFLGMSQYFPIQPSDLHWAKAGRVLTKAAYPSYYKKVLNVYNGTETVQGMSVKTATDPDASIFDFILDTEQETFRLPYSDGKRVLIAKKENSTDDRYWYELYSDGFCRQGCFVGAASAGTLVNFQIPFQNKKYNVLIGVTNNTADIYQTMYSIISPSQMRLFGTNRAGAVGTNWVTEGTASINQVTHNVCELYYYVGNETEDSDLINIAQVAEDKVNKAEVRTLVAPDFSTKVVLPTTLNLVQQMDRDGYIVTIGDSGSDISVAICDANGVEIVKLPMADTTTATASSIASPLLLAGTYFKVTRIEGSGTLLKFYAGGF